MTQTFDSHEHKTPTERIDQDLKELHLNWETLHNKSILDLGAGEAGFAQEAQKRGIPVICIDRHEPDTIPKGIEYIIGNANSMPFQENTFDLVVSFGGPPSGVESRQQLRRIISEILRVLKPGGEFHFEIRPLNVGRAVIAEEENRQEAAMRWSYDEMKEKYIQFLKDELDPHLAKKELFYREGETDKWYSCVIQKPMVEK